MAKARARAIFAFPPRRVKIGDAHAPQPSNHRLPKKRRTPNRRGKSSIGARRAEPAGPWLLTHPKCVAERAEDLAEVREMIEAGESAIAEDELRYLLSGCPDFIEAHALCGELAAAGERGDVELARGHFGYAFQLGEKAINAAGCRGPLPGAEPANAPWYDAALGLAWCFEKLGRSADADRVAKKACQLDPSDPAGIRRALDELRSGGLPMVTLG